MAAANAIDSAIAATAESEFVRLTSPTRSPSRRATLGGVSSIWSPPRDDAYLYGRGGYAKPEWGIDGNEGGGGVDIVGRA